MKSLVKVLGILAALVLCMSVMSAGLVAAVPSVVQVTTESELMEAVNAGTATGIEIADDMYISGKTFATNIPITIKSGYTLDVLVSDITAPLTVETGATLRFGDGGRNMLGGTLVNNGTVTVYSAYTHYIYGNVINNGSITNAQFIIYDWGKLTNNGTIDGVIRCNVAAEVGVKPSLRLATTEITLGDTIQLVGTGFIDGVELETVLKCTWTVGGRQSSVKTPYYDTTGAALDRSIKCESVTYWETDTVKYVSVTKSGTGGSPNWLDVNKSIRPKPVLYDVVYVGGDLGNDTNTGNTEATPFKSLQAAMTAVKPGGTIVMVGDAQVVKLDGDWANEAWTNFTTNITVEGNGYKLLNNASNSYRTIYVSGTTLTLNNVVLEPASGYKTLNFKGQSGASIVFNGCSGTYANISGFTDVTLNGTSLTSSGLTYTYMSATNLALNNGSTLYAQFSVDNLTSQGASSTIYTKRGYNPKISVSYSTENPINVIIEEATWSNFKNAQNIINFSAKNVGMAMPSDFNILTTIDGRTAVKDVKNSQYLTVRFAYTVTFKHNDGVTGDYVDYTDKYDELAFMPSPKRVGYIFDGWFDAPENGNKIEAGHVFTENTTLYAYWTLCDHTASAAQPDCENSAVCTVCEATIPAFGHDYTDEYFTNGEYHWHECSVCHEEEPGSKEAHGGTATCLDEAVCPTCDKEYGDLDPDNHVSDKFNYAIGNAGTHVKSHACCDAVADPAEAHTWKTPHDHVCTLCGYDGNHYHTNDFGYRDNRDGVSHSVHWLCCGQIRDAFELRSFIGGICGKCDYVKPAEPEVEPEDTEIVEDETEDVEIDAPVESETEETEAVNPVTGVALSTALTAAAAAAAVLGKKR